MSPIRSLALLLACAVLLGWAPAGRAQDAPKDETLDKLLKKLEDTQKKDQEKEASQPKGAETSKKAGADAKATPARPSGEVAPKDKDLDSLLEKLGETKDAPKTGGRPSAGPAQEPPSPNRPGQPPSGELKGKDKDFDEHLEELLGRKHKKKGGDQDSGPLADVIKEMRDVEERLGKPDTGEDTRKKQEQIVKKIDTLIEQLRNSSGQSQGKARIRTVRQGNQPGGQNGGPGAQGNTGGGVGPMKPARPPVKSVLANDKNPWGHLPPELRGVMDNVFKEDALPERADLIRRYYLSVNKKSQVREE
ncbi:MAG TPA: hypothetical protein VGZ22_23015 [Isosphaeraceae bacterium]|nr:hypothetical protein [Isosphaeraceae bacterium]